MSSPSQDDVDAGQAGSDRDDAPPAKLASEDSQAGSPEQLASELAGSTAVTPTPGEHLPVKCVLCEEEFKADEDNGVQPSEALREHMSIAHPTTAQFSALEHEQKEESSAPPLETEETERLQQAETVSEMSVERRLQHYWNIHDVRNFAPDYDGDESGLAELWARKFDGFERPAPYENRSVAPQEFLPMTDPAIFVDLLRNPSSRSTEELYAITMNTAHALRVWQDEYITIDKLRTKATDNSTTRKKIKARTLDDPLEFENKRQAELYGYPHQNKDLANQSYHEDSLVYGHHDPFFRAGRIPTSPKSKKLQAEAQEKGTKNHDGWTPIVMDGKEYLPRRRLVLDEIEHIIRKEEMKQAAKKRNNAKKNAANNGGAERVTRFSGIKRPTADDNSQGRPAPSASTPASGGTSKAKGKKGAPRASKSTTSRAASTAAPSPAPPGGKSTRSRAAQAATETAASTPAPTSVPAMGPPPTGKRRHAATTAPTPLSSASPALTPASPATDSPLAGPSLAGSPLKKSTLASSSLAGPSLVNSSRAGPAQPSLLQTDQPQVNTSLTAPPAAASSSAAASSAAAASATASPAAYVDPLELPENQEKIRQAKHPKRTEAMIKHWAKFIAEGRVRNPKRTKAQIEADRAAEQEAAVVAATNARKRKQSKGEPGTSVFSIKKPKLEENKTAGPQGGEGSNEPGGEGATPQPGYQYPTS